MNIQKRGYADSQLKHSFPLLAVCDKKSGQAESSLQQTETEKVKKQIFVSNDEQNYQKNPSWIPFCLEIVSYFNLRKDKIFSFEGQQTTDHLYVCMLNLLAAAPSDIKDWTEIPLYLFLQFSKETLANMYSAYIDNFLNAKDAVRTAKEAKPAFHKFLEVSVRLRKAKKRSLFLFFFKTFCVCI